MVQHDIRQRLKAGPFQRMDAGGIFRRGAVFCPHRSLLAEFPQVVQVVDPVTHILRAGAAFGRRGQPHRGKAAEGQPAGPEGKLPPVPSVRGQIPFKLAASVLVSFALA